MTSNNNLLDTNNSALVIVDIQTKLTSAMPMKVLARLQRNSALLCKAADLLDIPVLATEQYPTGLGELEPEIAKLLPSDAKRIDKTCFSCVRHEEFMEGLRETGRKQIVLIGMEAHICILQTSIDLLKEGFDVFVVTDAVCSRQRENYETAIQRLSNAGTTVCDSESVVFEWLGDASHEHFKTLSKMVK